MKKYSVLERDYEEEPKKIVLAGWNLKDGKHKIMGLIWEDFGIEGESILFKNIKQKEIAYSCSRYEDEQDARDEGYGYWINYHQTWKRGLGKCTVFTIEWEKSKKDSNAGEDEA